MNLGMETEILEFKRSTGELKEAVNSICAILNKHQHGELYFGIKPNGVPVGQTVTEESLRDVSQKIANCIEPRIYPEVRKVVLNGKECIYVKFEGKQVPYFASGIARIRVADEDCVMSPEEITELLLKSGREGNRWENLVSNRLINDVDEELLKRYTNQANEAGRITIGYTDKETVLNQLELTEGNRLLNAGKVLFSDDITQDLQMAIFATEERLTFHDIQRHHGPVLKLVDIAEAYIKSNIHWRVEFSGDLQRIEIPEIPMDAVREALLNSFCHKDYASGQSNEVAIYKDRIEIYNPGAFPEGLRPQDFIERPERPIRRNPKIARILYYSKDIESFGTGLKRIADACRVAAVEYEFKNLKSGFVVCFYRPNKKAEKKPIKAERKPIKAERYDMVVEYLKKHKFITNKEARELLCLAESTVKRILKEMVETGLLEIQGERKQRRYSLKIDVTPEVKPEADELKAILEAREDQSPTIRHEEINWD